MEDAIFGACRAKLPGYMVPTQLIRIDQIPLHPNGKLDRKKLEALPLNQPHPNTMEPPADTVEAHICQVFRTVLGKELVGRNSDFFALGGTSLSMIAFFAESGWENITPAQFIENPTPARLATLLKSRRPRRMHYVETLYKAEGGRRAYVLFPFAGGNAEAYVRLADSIKSLDCGVSLYFVPYLHTEAQCKEAAEEVVELLSGYDVFFYSHCAGSAVALQILQFLEEKQPFFVKRYFAAASVPFRTIGSRNGWNYVPDSFLLRILKKAGAPTDMLQERWIGEILHRFRADTDFAARFFAKPALEITCPMSLVIGKKDLFTRSCRRPEKHWEQYGRYVEDVYRIDTPTHYFQAENSWQLAQFLISKTKDSPS